MHYCHVSKCFLPIDLGLCCISGMERKVRLMELEYATPLFLESKITVQNLKEKKLRHKYQRKKKKRNIKHSDKNAAIKCKQLKITLKMSGTLKKKFCSLCGYVKVNSHKSRLLQHWMSFISWTPKLAQLCFQIGWDAV